MNIFNLSIQIKLEEVLRGLNLRKKAIADRKTNLGKLAGPFFIEGNDQVIDRVGIMINRIK